ncbi:hypothetical protein CANARDRAFT_6610 [[Candida] arabinofermentans NRRL YB-2248]|uniref:Transaldolase n=1 Tax=[Candida] arabinofermentans NRRL YB-2248 TaxID=983967 RepID=A0A1E4T2Z1_9ASCO|nr:hypothetical protein CANARDRAFT_6610 [[Candida] arabinofermentans NRRL YB-2248]
MVRGAVQNNSFDEISKFSVYSLDSQDTELSNSFKLQNGIQFLNATSNQAICLGNWLAHPNNVFEAIDLVNQDYKSIGKVIPTIATDSTFDSYLDAIVLKSIAVTGKKQLETIPGCVLSQTIPKYSSSTELTIKDALNIIDAYKSVGVDKSRVIIKIPTTWESMQASKILLLDHGVKSLATVVHSIEQAVIAAEAGCEYVATYVDPLQENLDLSSYRPTSLDTNYGYQITVKIHKYYKAHGIKSKLMSAATAGINTIWGLSGIDEMTLPGHMIHKMLSLPVPPEYELPVLKKTYTVAEGGDLLTFINDREKYYKSFRLNTEACERLEFANRIFDECNDKCKVLINSLLKEGGFIN